MRKTNNYQKKLFDCIVHLLQLLARKTGLTYVEVNILLYYFIVPLTWFVLIDIWLQIYYCSLAFLLFSLGFIAGCRDFKGYAEWLYRKSVTFLNFFNRYGSTYQTSSLWICVFLPLAVYILLVYLLSASA
jgi:hypothetical protein